MAAQSPSVVSGVEPVLEHEFRFVPVSRLPIVNVGRPTWHHFETSVLPDERHLTTYFETPSLALARQGITFRRRVFLEPGLGSSLPARAELTVKLPRSPDSGAMFARPEYTATIAPDASLTGHPLVDLIHGYTAGERVAPWFVSRTDRSGRLLRRGTTLIHMVWDRLTLPDDPDYVDAEIEAELVSGPVEELDALAIMLVTIYGLSFGDAGKRTRAGRHLARLGLIAFPNQGA